MSRAYRSDHRMRQAEQTRQCIVEALVEQVVHSHRADFSIVEVAERAGVSERTVYRYFPTREDLVQAIDEHFAAMPAPRAPESITEFCDRIAELYDWFADHADYVEAAHVTGLGRELHLRSRARRGKNARHSIERMLAPLSETERRQAFAVVRCMFGSANWRALRDEGGLTNDEAREAARWVARLLVEDLQKRLDAAGAHDER
jgi:AcrR family transcriptional regulator